MKFEFIKSLPRPGLRPALAVTCPLLVALVVAASSMAAVSPDESGRAFLKEAFGLSRADLGRVDAGQVVSRTLESTNDREVATLGIIRIATTPEKYVERLSDIATFKRTDDVLQIGTFSKPPQLSDTASLTLDEGDIRRLQSCRVDDCGVRISAEAIGEFARAVDWRAPDAAARATDVMRRVLLQYVARYGETGAPALMKYANTSERVDVRTEFAALVEGERVAWRYLDEVRRHVLDYPHDRSAATDLIYWSKERVHKRPVISVTHLSIMRQADPLPIRFAITSKQIYAMHYFDASLGLTLLVPDKSSTPPATYVVYVNRTRIDLFDGVFGGIARRIASGKARSLVGAQLTRLQRTLGS